MVDQDTQGVIIPPCSCGTKTPVWRYHDLACAYRKTLDTLIPPQEYSIERHGKDYALYYGRDDAHHGLNLCTLSDFDVNGEDTRKLIVTALNAYMNKEKPCTEKQ